MSGVPRDGAHPGCDAQCLLCHLELCRYVNFLRILPPGLPGALRLSSTKARVPMDLAHEPCVATGDPGPQLLYSHAECT